MMTILKLIGTILAGWFMSVGGLMTFVMSLTYLGYTQETVANWRPAPVDMFYAGSFIPLTGILVVGILIMGVYVLELRKKLQK